VPVPGRPRNPLDQTPDRWRERRHVFVARAGETPALMHLDTRADTVAPGTIRRLYRQAVNFIGAAPPVSVSTQIGQAPRGSVEKTFVGLVAVTRALRYRASTTYRAAGTDNTRFGAKRPYVATRHAGRPVTIAAGNQQGRPTIRNRMTSFGSRVPAVNAAVDAAERSKS
jgi:hypothetical protein